MRKTYLNHRTSESTESGSLAYKWHKAGDLVQVNTYYNEPHKTGLANVVHVNGAARKERDADKENFNHCKHIAEEVEAYADGNMYRCPECNEIIHLPDDVGNKYRCPDCGSVHDVDDLERLSIYDYMENILDIDYTCNIRKEYKSCSVCVGWGGPNIYIETDSAYVKLYWGCSRAEYPLSYSARDAIDEWAEEHFNCL